jgi:hypothetical protein
MSINKDMTSDKEGFFLLELSRSVFGPDRDNKKEGEPAAPELFSTSFITLSVGPPPKEPFYRTYRIFFFKLLPFPSELEPFFESLSLAESMAFAIFKFLIKS